MHILRSLRAHPWIVVIPVVALILVSYPETIIAPDETAPVAVPPAALNTLASSTDIVAPVRAGANASTSAATSTAQKVKKASIQAIKSVATTSPNEIVRIENPYTTPPLPFESINTYSRSALVNILCSTKSTGALKPITGSGIIVSESGVILTNAHVAQYVLIAQSGKSDLECVVRTGAPAASKWFPVVMYVPAPWIHTHAPEILQTNAVGTGEHDYALLYIAATTDGSPRPSTFPSVTPDSREAIGFVDDSVLTASYPVEFVGGTLVQSNLFPVTSIATIQRLMTFGIGSADALSLGGIITAQSGSSGGAVVNQWNKVIGLITTTSRGETTAERDLHAITTAYINRDMKRLTGRTLAETLASDPKVMADAFRPEASLLAQMLINSILGR
ncbi:MAG: trypsin-like peptidase domain-containing protein [Candidatus Pacebacteria bacterium]|nr:trypsin-like peptidase domain-containing protein [Candidatus Paceibacterota bacterium]